MVKKNYFVLRSSIMLLSSIVFGNVVKCQPEIQDRDFLSLKLKTSKYELSQEAISEWKARQKESYLITVSYTHLDVYKRQVLTVHLFKTGLI